MYLCHREFGSGVLESCIIKWHTRASPFLHGQPFLKHPDLLHGQTFLEDIILVKAWMPECARLWGASKTCRWNTSEKKKNMGFLYINHTKENRINNRVESAVVAELCERSQVDISKLVDRPVEIFCRERYQFESHRHLVGAQCATVGSRNISQMMKSFKNNQELQTELAVMTFSWGETEKLSDDVHCSWRRSHWRGGSGRYSLCKLMPFFERLPCLKN